jgi:hypothetical protein
MRKKLIHDLRFMIVTTPLRRIQLRSFSSNRKEINIACALPLRYDLISGMPEPAAAGSIQHSPP